VTGYTKRRLRRRLDEKRHQYRHKDESHRNDQQRPLPTPTLKAFDDLPDDPDRKAQDAVGDIYNFAEHYRLFELELGSCTPDAFVRCVKWRRGAGGRGRPPSPIVAVATSAPIGAARRYVSTICGYFRTSHSSKVRQAPGWEPALIHFYHRSFGHKPVLMALNTSGPVDILCSVGG